MNKKKTALLAMILLFMGVICTRATNPWLEGIVKEVVDGDTLKVQLDMDN